MSDSPGYAKKIAPPPRARLRIWLGNAQLFVPPTLLHPLHLDFTCDSLAAERGERNPATPEG
jgi:hypothetical protein